MSWSAFSAPAKKNTHLQLVLWFLLALVCVGHCLFFGFLAIGQGANQARLAGRNHAKRANASLDGAFLGAAQDTEGISAGLLHRPIQLEGEWIDKHTVYLDNRQMNARPGFYVLTPFKLKPLVLWWWCSAAGWAEILSTARAYPPFKRLQGGLCPRLDSLATIQALRAWARRPRP
jgi:surfeit locus 1 family protein